MGISKAKFYIFIPLAVMRLWWEHLLTVIHNVDSLKLGRFTYTFMMGYVTVFVFFSQLCAVMIRGCGKHCIMHYNDIQWL